MSVIKPSESGAHQVRSFHFGGLAQNASTLAPMAGESAAPALGSQPSAAPAAKKATDERLAQSRRIAELEEALLKAGEETEAARKAGVEEGRRLGREEAEKQDGERLADLRKSLEAARTDTAKALETQRSLAVDIARATLSQILGDHAHYPGMIRETAALWQDKLASSAVLKVRVSAADFSDPTVLEHLQHTLGNLEISTDSTLDPGACVFDLQLGQVDASIPLQAARADGVLSDYAIGAPAE